MANNKLISSFQQADGLIPTKGTRNYYNRVQDIDPDVKDFFRYFEVPGLGHCSGEVGGQPTSTFQALVDWVEHGVVPESLPIKFNDTAGVENNRILCPFPEQARRLDNWSDVTEAASWKCSI